MKRVLMYMLLFLTISSFVFVNSSCRAVEEINVIEKISYSELIAYTSLKHSSIIIEPEDPCALRDLNDLGGKKLIAFTFDDGPNNPTTLKLLENLEKYDARVTFFVVGSRINNHKESLIKAYETCNQIGNHTYSHYNLVKKNSEVVSSEINKTNESIYNVIGEYPVIMRPPYGSTSDRVKQLVNLPTISWNIDTLDWKYRDAERIANTIINNAEDGAVILLHDLYSTSVDGALLAMEQLKDEYAFVTIEEMAAIKGVELDKLKTYYNFK